MLDGLGNAKESIVFSIDQSLSLLRNLPSSVVVSDVSNGTILWVNTRNLQLIASDAPEQLIGRNLMEFISPEQHAVALRDIEALAHGAQPESVVYHLRRLDGGSVDVLISSVLVEFKGKPAMLSLVSDVSPQQRACRDLAESEERYRNLVDSSPDGLVVVVGESIVFANASFAKAMGVAPEAVVGRKSFDFIDKSFHRSIREARRALVLSGGSMPASPVILVTPSGATIDTSATSSVVRWHGEIATQTVFHDLSATAQANR